MHRDRVARRRRVRPSSVSFAARHACTSVPNWAASSLPAGQLRLHGLGQRQVHVVAAEQQVVADRVADEREFALLLARRGSG